MSSFNPFSGHTSRKVEEKAVAAEKKANNVPTGTIPEIKDWVGKDKDRAQRALDAESAHAKPRVSLVDALKEIISG